MTIKITTRMLYDLNNVTRWNSVRTIRKQNAAEHTFGVMLAVQWLNTYGTKHSLSLCTVGVYDLSQAFQLALVHDGVEGVSGDMTGPFKSRYLPELKRIEDDALNASSYSYYSSEVRRHVAIADMLECLAFLGADEALGNSALQPIVQHLEERLEAIGVPRELIDAWYKEFDFYDFPILHLPQADANMPEKVDGGCPF